MSRFDGVDASPDGPWSRWWCAAHRCTEDPGMNHVVALCAECGHVHDTPVTVKVLDDGTSLCEFCFNPLNVTS